MGIFRDIRRSFKKIDSTAKTQIEFAKKSASGALYAIPYSVIKGFSGASNIFTRIASFGSDVMRDSCDVFGFFGIILGAPIFLATLVAAIAVAAVTFATSVAVGPVVAAGLAAASAISTPVAIGSKIIEQTVQSLTGEEQPPRYRVRSYPKPRPENEGHLSKGSTVSPSRHPRPTGFASLLNNIKSIFR